MPGFQSTRLATEGALEPFFFLYTDDSIQGNPETCKQSSIMLNYEVKNNRWLRHNGKVVYDNLDFLYDYIIFFCMVSLIVVVLIQNVNIKEINDKFAT